MTKEEIDTLAALEAASTPGPWHVRFLDDDMCMGAVGISTTPDTGRHEDMRSGDWPGPELVAACLIQSPPSVVPSDNRWHENADLIVAVRNALPELFRLARIGAAVEQSA